jgi:hypothetical protein
MKRYVPMAETEYMIRMRVLPSICSKICICEEEEYVANELMKECGY